MFLKRLLDTRHTLAFRLTLWYATMFTLSSLCASCITYIVISSAIQRHTDQKLRNDFNEFSSIYKLKGESSAKIEMDIEAESEGIDKVFFRLLDTRGEVIASSNMTYWGAFGSGETVHSPVTQQGNHFFESLVVPDRRNKMRLISGPLGPERVLQIGHSMEQDEQFLALFRTIFAVSMLPIMLLSALVGLVMARNALSDVEQVIQTSLDITEGAFNERVKVKARKNEIERLASAFNRMLDRIQELISGIREMTDHIAHDLKTPITRIRGRAELELNEKASNPEACNLAAETIEECDYILQMIDTLLEISELEAKVTDPGRKAALDLTEIVNEAVDLFRPVLLEKGIEFKSQLPASCKLTGDALGLRRMVVNLLENAIKYTPSGGTVSISIRERESCISLEVVDTGIGIAERDLPNIFRRLYRCEPSRSQPGFGLGLSLALAVAKSHGGDITAESTLGKGSTFRIALPKQSFQSHNPFLANLTKL